MWDIARAISSAVTFSCAGSGHSRLSSGRIETVSTEGAELDMTAAASRPNCKFERNFCPLMESDLDNWTHCMSMAEDDSEMYSNSRRNLPRPCAELFEDMTKAPAHRGINAVCLSNIVYIDRAFSAFTAESVCHSSMPPPRLRVRSGNLRPSISSRQSHHILQWRCASAAAATAVTPAPPIESSFQSVPPIQRYPPKQPPSHKRPEFRKTQLHRQYTSLIRSSPLILIFQHNNLTSPEWMGIRRELAKAMRKVDEELAKANPDKPREWLGDSIKLQVVQGSIFNSAMKIVEFWDASAAPQASIPHATDPVTSSSAELANTTPSPDDPHFTHSLSRAAWRATHLDHSLRHGLEPLLSGPLATVAFPILSPQHLAALLRIVAPDSQFAAPKRRANPAYHEPEVQAGLKKLMLLGARVEGKVFSDAEVRWVGGIEGGLDGLRAQLVAMLQGLGASITGALEGAGRSVYFTLESRKTMLEEDGKEKEVEQKDEPTSS